MSDTKSPTQNTYPSYKTSSMEWLREVPEHWETTTIRRYCRVFSGATPDRANPNYWNGGTIPWIASGDVNLRRIVKAQQFISEAGYKASSTRYINPGSLVLALAGQGRTKGMVATVECRTTCNQSLAAIEPSHQLSNYNFLAYFLESRYADIRALVGNGLRDGLNLEHIRGIQTPLPPLDEQAAIVRYLDETDEKIQAYINAKQRLIALLEEQRQAIIHEAVTRGLDPKMRLKPSGVEWLGDVPEHWEILRLKSIVNIQTGGRDTVNRIDEGKYPFFVRSQTIERIDTWSYNGEAVLTAGDGVGVGKVFHYFNGKFDFHQRVYKFSEFSGILGRLFFHSFKINLNKVVLQGTAKSTVDSLRLPMLQNFPIPLPPRDEQEAIVDFCDKHSTHIDLATELARREIELMEEYRTRLIADVVTGKLDVRKAAEDLPRLEATKISD